MSDNIIPFNGEQEDEHCCRTCDLVLDFVDVVKEHGNDDEALFAILSEMASQAKSIGIQEFLIREIDSKINLLEHLEDECDCE